MEAGLRPITQFAFDDEFDDFHSRTLGTAGGFRDIDPSQGTGFARTAFRNRCSRNASKSRVEYISKSLVFGVLEPQGVK